MNTYNHRFEMRSQHIFLFLLISCMSGFIYAHHEKEFEVNIDDWVDLYEVEIDLQNLRRYSRRMYEPGLILLVSEDKQLIGIVAEPMQIERVTEQMTRTNNPFYRVVFIKNDGDRVYVDHDGWSSNLDLYELETPVRVLSYSSPEGLDISEISKVVVQGEATEERLAMIAERDKNKLEKSSRIDELVEEAIFPELILDQAYQFEIELPDGEIFNTNDYLGKVLLIDMWSTGCGPCYKMFPKLNEFYGKYSREEVEVLGVAMFDTVEMMNKVVEKHDLQWLQTNLPGSDFVWANWKSMGMVGMPTYLILDEKGVLRKVLIGSNSDDELFAAVEALLQ